MITVRPVENRLDFTTHAEKFRQGGRNVYSFTATLREINNLLPDRDTETETKVSEANRPLTLLHAREIQQYLATRTEWLVSSILTYVDPKYIEFAGYPIEGGAPSTEIGVLNILKTDTGAKALGIFDGQHRRRAISDLMRSLDLDSDDPHIRDLAASKIPILLYEENDIPKLRLMFLDHAESKATEANTKTRFNQLHPFSLAAVAMVEEPEFKSRFFLDRVEMERTRVARTSSCVIAINQLERAIKIVERGYNGRLSKDQQFQYLQGNLEPLYQRCLEWADQFLPQAREEYEDLYNGAVRNSEIPSRRTRSLAYNATVIQVLAGCYHEWCETHEDWSPLAEFIRQSDLTPGKDVNEGALLVDAGLVQPKGITPVPRIQEVTRGIEYIVDKAGEFAEGRSSTGDLAPVKG